MAGGNHAECVRMVRGNFRRWDESSDSCGIARLSRLARAMLNRIWPQTKQLNPGRGMNDETNPAPIHLPVPPLLEHKSAPYLRPPPSRLVSYWLKQLLVCNPFYLASAALLLYGIYRISLDGTFFTTETRQLIFNFSALQFYELLLALTATLLVTRRIWYDASLLVVLENLLWIVPFILVSQAAFIEPRTATLLCSLAVGLAIGRTVWLRMRARDILPSGRALLCGLPILLLNAAWPIIYRHFQETRIGINIASGAAYVFNELNWFWLLPAAAALLLLLPAPEASHPASPRRRWFPLLLFAFWLLGTGVHLYALGYVYDFKLRREQLAPVLWVLAWAMQMRFTDLIAAPATWLRHAVLVLPVLAVLPAAFVPDSRVFFCLSALNLAAFAIWLLRQPDHRWALQLGLLSFAAMVASLPVDFAPVPIQPVTQPHLIELAALAYLIVGATLSRHPKVALLGAGAALFSSVVLRAGHPDSFHWAAQAGLVYFLLHSLRWQDAEHQGAPGVRWFVAAAWVIHTFIWVRCGAPFLPPLLAAGLVFVVWTGRAVIFRLWQPLALPFAAGLVVLCGPTNFLIVKTQAAPAGLLYLVGSFALFGLGTAVALTKHRWHKNHQT